MSHLPYQMNHKGGTEKRQKKKKEKKKRERVKDTKEDTDVDKIAEAW